MKSRHELQELMQSVRDAKFPLAVDRDGIPVALSEEPYFERMEFLAALTAGYNLAIQQLNIVRQLYKSVGKKEEGEKCTTGPAPTAART